MEAALRCALARAGGGWGIREWVPGGSSRGDPHDCHLPSGAAGLRPRPPAAAVALPPPPHPRGPRTPLRRPPGTSRRRRPLQARRRTRVGERLGRGLSPRGQRLRPAGTKHPAGEQASGEGSTHRVRAGRGAGPGSPPPGRAGAERPLQSASCGAGEAAVLGGRSSDAAAAPFSRPGPCSAASSPSPGPRRRLSLGAARAAPLHQGRAGPRGTSRKVRAGGRLPQLLVAIFNPPPPPALPTSRAR